MKKLLIVLMFLLISKTAIAQQANKIEDDYPCLKNSFPINDSCLAQARLLSRAQIFRGCLRLIKEKINLKDSVTILLYYPYGNNSESIGTMAIGSNGHYDIWTPFGEFINDTSMNYVYSLTCELCKIKFGIINKILNDEDRLKYEILISDCANAVLRY